MKKQFVWILALVGFVAISAQAADLDANGDGKVTKDEFVEYKKATSKKFKPKRAGSEFKKADANGDGVLTGDEVDAASKGNEKK